MNDRDLLRQERLERIEVFGTANHGDWPADSDATVRYANISQHLQKLAAAEIGQKRTPVTKQTLLDGLWLDFKNIARTARSIDLDEPGFATAYRLPLNRTEKLIKLHADGLLGRLEDNHAPEDEGGDSPAQKAAKAALRGRFVKYFLPADFVTALRTDRDAIDAKNSAKTNDNLFGVESTGEIEQILEAATEDVAHLDAAMQNLYARDAAKLRAWLAASRVERAAQREKKPAPPAGKIAQAPLPAGA